jgi:alpha-1,6-mannosyltransferase
MCHIFRFLLFPFFDLYIVDAMFIQFLARFLLLLINLHGWLRLAGSIQHKYNTKLPHIGAWLLIITACQFHLPFYSSRMLPNVFALAVVLHSYCYWIQDNIRLAAAGLVFATAVFRCDILLLLASLGLSWLIRRQLSILEAIRIGVLTGFVSLMLIVPMDSLLWQRLVWPEGEVFYFNTILGKSSDWGTSPWHWYFTSALPKAMLLTALLVPLSSLRIPELLVSWERRWHTSGSATGPSQASLSLLDTQWLPYIIPTIGFVILYSFLGHKEMRFIFPSLPILNILAAAGMARLHQLAFPPKEKGVSWIAMLGFICGVMVILVTLMGSLVFVAVSTWNYPGGDALIRLAKHVQREQSLGRKIDTLHVHVDVASAMSGVSLFGQHSAQMSTPQIPWVFDKSGYEDENSVGEYTQFTHLLSEERNVSPHFHVLDVIQGKPRLDFRRARIAIEDAIFILERNDWGGEETKY